MDSRGPILFLIVGVGIVFGVMATITSLFQFHIGPGQGAMEMKYTDLVTILLTGLSAMLTLLTIFIGALAVWGYSQFQKMTRVASAAHLEKMLKGSAFRTELETLIVQHVSSQLKDGELRKILAERIDTVIQSDATKRAEKEGAGGEQKFVD